MEINIENTVRGKLFLLQNISRNTGFSNCVYCKPSFQAGPSTDSDRSVTDKEDDSYLNCSADTQDNRINSYLANTELNFCYTGIRRF